MLKKSIKALLLISPIMAIQFAFAQPKLGMHAGVNSGFKYLSSSAEGSYTGNNGSAYGYFGEGHISFLGLLQKNSKFFIGDYVGGGVSLCAAKYESTFLHGYYMDANFIYGGQIGYSINTDIDAGIRFLMDNKFLLVGSDQSPIGMTLPMFSACGRYKKFYADIAFGSASKKEISKNDKYHSFISNIRYSIQTSDRKVKYLGLRIENIGYQYISSNVPTGRTDTYLSYTLSYGVMF